MLSGLDAFKLLWPGRSGALFRSSHHGRDAPHAANDEMNATTFFGVNFRTQALSAHRLHHLSQSVKKRGMFTQTRKERCDCCPPNVGGASISRTLKFNATQPLNEARAKESEGSKEKKKKGKGIEIANRCIKVLTRTNAQRQPLTTSVHPPLFRKRTHDKTDKNFFFLVVLEHDDERTNTGYRLHTTTYLELPITYNGHGTNIQCAVHRIVHLPSDKVY